MTYTKRNDGYDREELNAEGRAGVMAWWRRVEASRPGMWLSRHTDLLSRLSDEESHLLSRCVILVALVALIASMCVFLACGGRMLPFALGALPILAVAFALCMAP